MSPINRNPYVGPRTFEEEDANLFFGREREARDLLSLVISEPLVLFYAESGAGKSSIINTRLIPNLREEHFNILPTGRVGGNLPDELDNVPNIFVFNLLASLDKGKNTPQALADLTIVEYLRMYKMSAAEESDTFYDDLGEESARVLIIDQFEEIVTTNLDRWQDRAGFFEQLSEAIKEDQLLWIVLTLREDYVASLEPFARLMPNRLRARFYMQRMKARAAEQAIELPAAQARRPFAPGVARQLVDNLRQLHGENEDETLLGEYVEPVQLQVVCYQLWQNLEHRPLGEITAQDLQELGDVDKALGDFYEQALSKALQNTDVSEVAIRNWFERHLITEANTRGTVYQGARETAGMPNEVVLLLANQYLLRAEQRAGGMWYELVHDRFVDPILQANQVWRLRQSPLLRAAEEWDRSGRERSRLYSGPQLQEALAATQHDKAEPIVRNFLTASEEAESQHQLEAARQATEELRQRAEEQARTARRFRRFTIGLVGLFLLAIILSIYAFQQQEKAVNNEQLASTQAANAVINQNLAATEAANARTNAQLAATSEAQARQAQATAVNLLDNAEAAAEAARIREADARNISNQLLTREANSFDLFDEALELIDEGIVNLTPPPRDPQGFSDRAMQFAQHVDDFEADSACKAVTLFDYYIEEEGNVSIQAGEPFTLYMILLNDAQRGECPWAPSLTIQYDEGEAYSLEDDEIPLAGSIWEQVDRIETLTEDSYVLGGDAVIVAIPDLVAPWNADTYFTEWQLWTENGKRFGPPLDTEIEVYTSDTPPPTPPPSSEQPGARMNFDFFVNICEEDGPEWSCEIIITPFGGSGRYEIIIYDHEPPNRYLTTKSTKHRVEGFNCEPWNYDVEIVDNRTGESVIEEIILDPTAINLFENNQVCGE